MKQIIIALLLAITIQTSAKCQIKELKIGDKCPDVVFSKIINYDRTVAHLSDFKDKLVIIDFWATWCGPCITAMHHLDSLQRVFNKEIIIMPVSNEKQKTVSYFMKNYDKRHGIILPSVVEDNTTRQYFPHSLIPHEVWIDKNGTVIAITAGTDVTAENITKALNKDVLSAKTKKDILKRDYHRPLLSGGLGDGNTFDATVIKYYSVLTSVIDGTVSSGSAFNFIGNQMKIQSLNSGIWNLYSDAFCMKWRPYVREKNPDFLMNIPSRIIWEAKDSTLFNWPGKPDALEKMVPDSIKQFCYEAYLPASDSLHANRYVVEDLNRYFSRLLGIEGHKEKRKVKCWALVLKSKDVKNFASKGGTPLEEEGINNDMLKIRNKPITELMWSLVMFHLYLSPIPIIDETGYSGLIDLEIHGNLEDPYMVAKSLNRYGLDLILVERDLDMIVIADVKQK